MFPGTNHNTLLRVLARMEQRVTAHGFRSSFCDWAYETTPFPPMAIEVSLAHTSGDKTVRAYQRGNLMEKRRELMQAWSTYSLNK